MIISRIIQNGLDLSIETNDIPYQRSANHKIQFVKDPNYSNYSLQAYGKLPKTGYQESEEFKLELEDGNYIKLPSAVFATKGIFQIAISLTGVNGDIINLGIVSYKIRKSFGDSTNILPDNEKAWNSFVHLEVDNYFNNTYQSKLNDFNTKYDDTITKYTEIVETSTEQLKENIAESKNDAIKQIQSEGQSYQDQINELQKSEALQDEVLDKLNEEVDLKLTQPYLNNNDSTRITSSDNGSLKNIVVKGNTVQNSTKGLNLINCTTKTTTINGITMVNNEDGTYTVNGTATNDFDIAIAKYAMKQNIYYTLSGCPSGGSETTYYLDPRGYGYDTGSGLTIRNPERDFINYIRIVIKKDVTVNNLLFKPMFNEGQTAQPFEPYTGGQPSPSPEYPQEVKGVNKLSGVICGKNLINPATVANNYFINDMNGVLSPDSRSDATDYIKIQPNTNYYISKNPSNRGRWGAWYDKDKKYVKGVTSEKYGMVVTSPSNAHYIRLTLNYDETNPNFVNNMYLYRSNTDDLLFETFFGSNLNYTLQNPLYKLGDVYDYIDLNRGKIVRNIGVITFDGSDDEDIRLSLPDGSRRVYLYSFRNSILSIENINAYCKSNMFKFTNLWNDGVMSHNHLFYVSSTNIYVSYNEITSLNDFKTWLNKNPITVVYQLATPTEEPLPPDLQTLLQSLKSYYPQTNIMFDTEVEPYINFDYKLNLKSWIEDKDNKEIIYDKQNKEKDKYSSTFFENMFALQRTGKVYTVKFPKWETSHISTGEKLDANAGLVCEPSTKSIKGQNDYANIPLFKTYDVNAYVDDEGVRHVTAIKGDKNFKDEGKVDVFVLGMSYYEKVWEDDQYWYYSRTDMPRDGYTIARECINRDGSIQPFALYSKYVSGDIDGILYSSKGLQPARTCYSGSQLNNGITYHDNSYNNLIKEGQKKGKFYSAGMICDYKYILTTFYLKYATLNSQSVMAGCTNYSAQYNASIQSEEKHTYFPVTKARADAIEVNSYVSVGYSSTNKSLDRGYNQLHRYGDSVKVLKKEALDDSNVAIYLDVKELFNTMPVTVADGVESEIYITSMHWKSGFSDDILDRDGCPCDTKVQLTNGKFPMVIQGIECMVGGYETYGNAFIDIVDATGKREVYIQNDASQLTTNMTTAKTTYKKSPYAIQPTKLNSWNYITRIDFDLENGAFVQTNVGQDGSSTTTGFADGVYIDNASSGQREFLGVGNLRHGSSTGLSCLNASYGVGLAYWHILARLSINGVGGELTA